MTHYSAVDSIVSRDSGRDEWIDLYEREARLSGVSSVPSTLRQRFSHEDSSPMLNGSWPSPETPMRTVNSTIASGGSDHGQEGHHQNHENLATRSKATKQIRGSIFEELQNGWFWEVLGLVVCVLSFGAIVSIVSLYSGKEIPSFSYGITLNGIISFLGNTAKASMLLAVSASISQFKWLEYRSSAKAHSLQALQIYDSASRGPRGALMMLFHSRGRYLASVGAIIAVASFGFEPFPQTLVVYPQRMAYKDSTDATVVRAEIYNDTSATGYGEVLGFTPGGYDMNNAMLRGVFDGVLAPRIVPTSCTSGNCTWPTFSTLGICSECEDVTKYAQKHFSCLTSDTGPEQINCTVNLPGSPPYLAFNVTIYDSTGGQENPYMTVWPSNLNYVAETQWYDYLDNGSFAGVEAPLLPIAIVNFDPFTLTSITQAYQCAFSFCVKTYLESVDNGSVTSTVLSTWPGQFTGDDISISPPAEKQGNVTSTKFTVDSSTANGVRGTIGTKFFGDTKVAIDALGHIVGHEPSSDVMDALNQTGNIPGLMDNVATSMTNHIRGVSAVPVVGQMGTLEIYVHVRWVWLTLPGVLIVISAAFLALAMLETRQKQAEVWKDSSLALLFHGFEHTATPGAGPVNKLSQMENLAKGMNVRLERIDAEENWHLSLAK